MSNGCKKAVPQQKLSASQRLCRAQSCGGAIRRNRRHRCLVASFGVLGLLVEPLNHCGRIESLELHKLHKHFLWEKEVSKAIIVPRHLINLTKRNSRLHDCQPQNFVLFRFAGIFVQSKFGNQFPMLPRISNAEPCMLVLQNPAKEASRVSSGVSSRNSASMTSESKARNKSAFTQVSLLFCHHI